MKLEIGVPSLRNRSGNGSTVKNPASFIKEYSAIVAGAEPTQKGAGYPFFLNKLAVELLSINLDPEGDNMYDYVALAFAGSDIYIVNLGTHNQKEAPADGMKVTKIGKFSNKRYREYLTKKLGYAENKEHTFSLEAITVEGFTHAAKLTFNNSSDEKYALEGADDLLATDTATAEAPSTQPVTQPVQEAPPVVPPITQPEAPAVQPEPVAPIGGDITEEDSLFD